LEELNQLHERQALLPLRKKEMSHEERKKALDTLCSLKNVKVPSIWEDVQIIALNNKLVR